MLVLNNLIAIANKITPNTLRSTAIPPLPNHCSILVEMSISRGNIGERTW